MEPTKTQMRLVLPLLKAPVTDITDKGFTILIGAQYGSPTTIRITHDTTRLDLHDGDLLTLYTEVLLAQPSQSPIQ
jgi:hypothetical protein